MPVVQNVARDPAGNPSRATVTIRLIAGDVGSVNTPGYSTDGTVIGTVVVRADADGLWSAELNPNDDYLPVGTYYEIHEQPAGTSITYVHHAEVPDVVGPVDLVGILVDPVTDPDSLYLLATQKGASGGLATLDGAGQVPLDQLGNAPTGGGGGAVDSVFGRTGAVTAQGGDYTKAQVGLSNVDNTTDAGKPVSTLQAAADTAVASAAAAALTAHDADTTAVHGIANTANLVLTSDSRLSDARTPTAHAASHGSGNTDPITVAESQVTGLVADLAGKQPLDGDLTTIAGLTATTDNVLQAVASAWASRTPAQLKATLALAKGDVGLSNVDNTSDANKPVSSATQTALDAKQPLDADLTTIAALDSTTAGALATDGSGWIRKTYAALKTALALVKGDVGLGSVDNTSDVGKPISTATQTALDAKQALDSDLTTIAGLTATTDNMIQSVGSAWASRTPTQVKTALALNNLDNTTDAGKPVSTAQQTALDLKANLASPTFTGTPTLPTGTVATTQAAADSSTKLATTAFVTTADALKADLASPALTGNPTAPTQSQGNSSTRLATTAYVQTECGLLVPKSTVTTKGDLIVATGSGAITRVAVGANDTVLTADSAQASGVKWAAAAGGSGTDYKVASKPRSGNWYRAPGWGPVGSNLSMATLNRCYFVPFRLAATTTFDRIGVDVATAGTATAVLRLGIYSPDGTGDTPGTLVLDAGTVAGDSTGAKQATISQALNAGTYWLAVCNQVASGTAIRATTSYDPLIYYFSGANMFTGTTAAGSLVATGISGAFASNPTIADNDNAPIIGLRAA